MRAKIITLKDNAQGSFFPFLVSWNENGIRYSHVFETENEARAFIKSRWTHYEIRNLLKANN